jgi:hypothetical protein
MKAFMYDGAGFVLYLLIGVLFGRFRWQRFVKEETEYWDYCLSEFLRGDVMNDFRMQTWMEVVSGDPRLRDYPPAPNQFVSWLNANVALWPLILFFKLARRVRSIL